MHVTQTFSIKEPNGPNAYDLLFEHNCVEEKWLETKRDSCWPKKDPAFRS